MRNHKLQRSRWLRLCLFLLLGLLAAPLSAQEISGHGVIAYLDDNEALASGFEMLNCQDVNCVRIMSLIYPTLFGTAGSVNAAVVLDPPALPAAEQTYVIKDGLSWSDGTPITAYDAAFSLLGRESLVYGADTPIIGLRIDDERRFTLGYADPDCAAQARIDSAIIPAQVFNPDFRAFADSFAAEAGELPSPRDWRDVYSEWSEGAQWRAPVDRSALLVTAGRFSLVFEDNRVYLEHDDLVLSGSDAPDSMPVVEQFLLGEANLLLDPPFERRADLRATPGLQLYEAPGYAVDYLVFNQSDPNYPRDAFIDGEPLEQLPHRYFSDVRVRRAVQLAIDVPALIDGVLYGGGVGLNGAYSPVSWAYDPELPPVPYDPDTAKRLLDEAGWRDIDGDGWRECFGCLYASPGEPLIIYLYINYDGVRDRAGDILRVQLARVGINLYADGGNGEYQDFDLLLTGTNRFDPAGDDPDLYRLFARQWDRLGVSDGNVGSADYPELETLLDQARRVPGCAIDERAALYHEAQLLLRAEVPAIWLYARHDFYAARGIAGFVPQPGEPFWNVNEWVVAR